MHSQTSANNKVVTVKFDDLNPAIKKIIKSGEYFPATGIRELRRLRGLAEINGLTFTGFLASEILKNRHNSNVVVLATIGTAASLHSRQSIVSFVQKKHKELVELMNKHGLLDVGAEGSYPRDWMNPSIIARTHPIFYVKANGDLVFIKERDNVSFKIEYARYLYQKTWAGKLGLNPWRWRAFLRPPKAPEKVRAWAKRYAQNLALGLKGLNPVPQHLVPVPARASFAKSQKRLFFPRRH